MLCLFSLQSFLTHEKIAKKIPLIVIFLGKHGHAKVHMVGIDIFNGKKYEDICPSTHNMDVPHVKREDYQLTDIDEGFLCLMNDGGDIREDLKVPDGELGTTLRADFEAGKELLVSFKLHNSFADS